MGIQIVGAAKLFITMWSNKWRGKKPSSDELYINLRFVHTCINSQNELEEDEFPLRL